MKLWSAFWADEAGVLLSSEAVVVGTVAVVGVTAGLSAVSTAVNKELQDVGFAIRSLDQSYSIPAQTGCGACTAGSSFTQQPVDESLAELKEMCEKAEKADAAQQKRLQQQLQQQRRQSEQKAREADRKREEARRRAEQQRRRENEKNRKKNRGGES